MTGVTFKRAEFNVQASWLRFGKDTEEQAGRWEKLVDLAKSCGYCGTSLTMDTATFDHIRPNSANGTESRSNGVVSCSPCNNDRGNVPFLNFLEGERGRYSYKQKGKFVRLTDKFIPKPDPMLVQSIQARFAEYFKHLMQNHRQFQSTWLGNVLNNITYPVWQHGQEPTDEALKSQQFQQQVKRLMNLLVPHDKSFWLGQPFQDIVDQHLKDEPLQAMKTALNELRQQLDTPIRFGMQRLGQFLKAC